MIMSTAAIVGHISLPVTIQSFFHSTELAQIIIHVQWNPDFPYFQGKRNKNGELEKSGVKLQHSTEENNS